MLISHPTLDSAFSNPDSLPPRRPRDLEALLLQQLRTFCQQGWTQHHRQTVCQEPQGRNVFRDTRFLCHHRLDQAQLLCPEEDKNYGLPPGEGPYKIDVSSTQGLEIQNIGLKKKTTTTTSVEDDMSSSRVEPEDDLRCLSENARRLELSGYYYGSLSWLDASRLLHRCRPGTFLVRDSEHARYLYTLSVQTRKGPTSCRIDYCGGRFRLDSSKELAHKMPRFECVPDLVDFYARLLPRTSGKAVWLDMDEENAFDVPVQIYRPLYRHVRSLQHMCRVAVARDAADQWPSTTLASASNRTDRALRRAMAEDPDFSRMPALIKDYLGQYPYTQ